MRSLAAFVACGLLCCLLISMAVITYATAVSAQTTHGCAPPVPPTVSGTLIQPAAQRGLLFINEVLLAPSSIWNCSELPPVNSVSNSWVEIYNAQNQPFDLYAVHASLDSGNNTNPFYFPFGSAIAPHGYLVVFPRTSTPFLSTESATLRLLINNTAVDSVTIPALPADYSYARIPDGTTTWQISSNPTIAASNTLTKTAPTPKPTSTAHSGTGKGSGGGAGNGSQGGSYGSGNNTGGNNNAIVNGTQPAWSSLHLPTTDTTPNASNSAPIAPTTLTSPTQATQSTNDVMDIPHKLTLTVLLILLTAALFWCWHLFRKP